MLLILGKHKSKKKRNANVAISQFTYKLTVVKAQVNIIISHTVHRQYIKRKTSTFTLSILQKGRSVTQFLIF